MLELPRTFIAIALLASPLSAQIRPVANRNAGAPTREIGAVFISMSSCCDSLTTELRGPIDSVRRVLRERAQQEGTLFRMIGVSLDWRTEDGWNYLKQFGEFDEIAVGSNWFGMLPEVLMFSGRQDVEAKVPQLVIYQRMVTRGNPQPTFGPRTILKRLGGSADIAAWVRDGARLP